MGWTDFRLSAIVQYLVTSEGSLMFTNVALALGTGFGKGSSYVLAQESRWDLLSESLPSEVLWARVGYSLWSRELPWATYHLTLTDQYFAWENNSKL